jgi:hypothetical protein
MFQIICVLCFEFEPAWGLNNSVNRSNVRERARHYSSKTRVGSRYQDQDSDDESSEQSASMTRTLCVSLFPERIRMHAESDPIQISVENVEARETLGALQEDLLQGLSDISENRLNCLTSPLPTLASLDSAYCKAYNDADTSRSLWLSQRESAMERATEYVSNSKEQLKEVQNYTNGLNGVLLKERDRLISQRQVLGDLEKDLSGETERRAKAVANLVTSDQEAFDKKKTELANLLSVNSLDQIVGPRLSESLTSSFASVRHAVADLEARRNRIAHARQETLDRLIQWRNGALIVISDNDAPKRESMMRLFIQMNARVETGLSTLKTLITDYFGYNGG